MTMGVAVVGLGGISRGHIAAWKRVNGATLRAVCDMVPERAAAVGEEHGVASFTEVEALLERDDIHIVDLCLPPAAHAPVALQALAAGRHVMVEKPIALTLDDATRMREAAVKAGVQLGVVSQLRFSSHMQQLRAWLQEGRLGKPLAAHLELKGFLPFDFYQTSDKAYLRDPESSGGGMLMQVGIHHVDMLRFQLGDVDAVTWARVENLAHPGARVEDFAVAHLTFASGVNGLVESASIWPQEQRRQTHLTIATEQFTIGIVRDRVVETNSQNGQGLPWPEYVPGTHQLQLQDFVDSVASGRPCGVTAGDGARSLAVVRAIYEAGATGTAVDLTGVNAGYREAM